MLTKITKTYPNRTTEKCFDLIQILH